VITNLLLINILFIQILLNSNIRYFEQQCWCLSCANKWMLCIIINCNNIFLFHSNVLSSKSWT